MAPFFNIAMRWMRQIKHPPAQYQDRERQTRLLTEAPSLIILCRNIPVFCHRPCCACSAWYQFDEKVLLCSCFVCLHPFLRGVEVIWVLSHSPVLDNIALFMGKWNAMRNRFSSNCNRKHQRVCLSCGKFVWFCCSVLRNFWRRHD